MKLAICICTYQRVSLLQKIIEDLEQQTRLPEYIIVADGDPASNEVITMLKARRVSFPVIYIPSNHGNLAYQRYLGWQVAQAQQMDILLYFDDDLRIQQLNAIEKIIFPFTQEQNVVGVTARAKIDGDIDLKFSEHAVLLERERASQPSLLVRWLGSSQSIPPGGLTPVGSRQLPEPDKDGYGTVEWLYGRVMAYRMTALGEDIFSEDMFALTHIHCGMGEDTFLSHRVSMKGKMLLAFQAVLIHPHDALPNSYPIQAKKLGYAIAYSRRLLNDYYRETYPPYFSDRLELAKSYFGNVLLSWCRVISRPAPRRSRAAYAWGYTLGALRGLLQRPTAKALTPNINWRAEALSALSKQNIIPGNSV